MFDKWSLNTGLNNMKCTEKSNGSNKVLQVGGPVLIMRTVLVKDHLTGFRPQSTPIHYEVAVPSTCISYNIHYTITCITQGVLTQHYFQSEDRRQLSSLGDL
jgi:hypothetical protein